MGLPKEITSNYYVSRKLGSGACGLVRLVYDRRSCQEYAMKIVKKNMLATSTSPNHLTDPNRVMNEAKIMKNLDHVSFFLLFLLFLRVSIRTTHFSFHSPVSLICTILLISQTQFIWF